jgi:parallel beta-helix repeat protein
LEVSQNDSDTITNNNCSNNANDGFDLTTLTDSSFSGNTAKNNAKAGIFLDANCSGNTLTGNTASANANSGFGGYDLEDLSAGAGTDGTANTWHKNKAGTANPIGLLTA